MRGPWVYLHSPSAWSTNQEQERFDQHSSSMPPKDMTQSLSIWRFPFSPALALHSCDLPNELFQLFHIYSGHMHVCVVEEQRTCTQRCACAGQRATHRSWFSPSTIWVSEMELKFPSLAISIFTHCITLPAFPRHFCPGFFLPTSFSSPRTPTSWIQLSYGHTTHILETDCFWGSHVAFKNFHDFLFSPRWSPTSLARQPRKKL